MVGDQEVKGSVVVRGLGVVGGQAPPPRPLTPTSPYPLPVDP